MNEKEFLTALNASGISNIQIGNIRKSLKDKKSLADLKERDFLEFKFLTQKSLTKIYDVFRGNFLSDYFKFLKENNIKITTILDENYPKNLKNITNPPEVMYYKGTIKDDDFYSIAFVGSRKCTSYGKNATKFLVKEISKLGITVVSGVAQGIDSIAHKSALEVGNRTLGVLGNGIDVIYPASNKSLYLDIEKNGAIISEYPLKTKPSAYNFPLRNRIISGFSLGVVVVEAMEKSGSLITASLAGEQGREIFAVPGNINSIYSKGTNSLIKDGAKIVTCLDDILEEIYILKDRYYNKVKDFKISESLSEEEYIILDLLKNGNLSSDEISELSGLGISKICSILTELELKNLIEEIDGQIFLLSK